MLSFRSYMLSVMKDEKRGVFAALIRYLLSFLAFFYRICIDLVNKAYLSGIRKIHKMPVPVVSIGNITLGGTGKTPMTAFVADHYIGKGKKTAVLMRGYGNDEHKMLKDSIPGLMVFPGQDRVKSAKAAIEQGADVLILDDGFQHRRLGRDLDIVLLDCPYPFAKDNLFPRGVLREPVSSLRRAGMVVLTKSDRLACEQRERVTRRLSGLVPGVPVVFAEHKPSFITDVTGAVYPIEHIVGKKVYLVSGIADPGYFEDKIRELGAMIIGRSFFDDHHKYTQSDIDLIYAKCFSTAIEMVLVTEKDHIKLKKLDISRLERKLFIFHVDMNIVEGRDSFVGGLDRLMDR